LANGSHTFQVRAADLAGNIDPTSASQTWTIDLVPPTVASTTPVNNATNVGPTTDMTAVFSEAMDPASLTAATFILRTKQGNNPVAATVSYDPIARRATLHPTASLASLTAYRATVRGTATGVKDLAGNPLVVDYSWTFTSGQLDVTPPTVTLTAPSNGAKIRSNVTLSANASDNAAVASVSFLVNGIVIGTDTTSPYSLSWNSATLADGNATIAARATDTSNLTTTTANITVTIDNTPPDTTISSGPSGSVG